MAVGRRVPPLVSPFCIQLPQQKSVPGLGDCQQSPGEPWPEPGDGVSSHGCPASGAQGTGLGLWHWRRLGPHLCPGQCHQGPKEHVQGSGGPRSRSCLLLRPLLTWRQGWSEPAEPELKSFLCCMGGHHPGPHTQGVRSESAISAALAKCQRCETAGGRSHSCSESVRDAAGKSRGNYCLGPSAPVPACNTSHLSRPGTQSPPYILALERQRQGGPFHT